jgi:hypothetical protein
MFSRSLLATISIVVGLLLLQNWSSGQSLNHSTKEEEEKERYQAIGKNIEMISHKLADRKDPTLAALDHKSQLLAAANPEQKPMIDTIIREISPSALWLTQLHDAWIAWPRDETFLDNQSRLKALEQMEQAITPNALEKQIKHVADFFDHIASGAPANQASPAIKTHLESHAASLVGNAQYGSWITQGGINFWQWYGAYALFRDVLGRRSWEYDRWRRDQYRAPYGSSNKSFWDRFSPAPRYHDNPRPDNIYKHEVPHRKKQQVRYQPKRHGSMFSGFGTSRRSR